jgi:hypothetical protein
MKAYAAARMKNPDTRWSVSIVTMKKREPVFIPESRVQQEGGSILS